VDNVAPGFRRDELAGRYNVTSFEEDDWHAHTGRRTSKFLAEQVGQIPHSPGWVLNAGSGVYQLGLGHWNEVSVDLFDLPISRHVFSVCASVKQLPFHSAAFAGVICVGEVLSYCDPAQAISEFARVLVPTGCLICDFSSSRSIKYWGRLSFGRAADIVTDVYNSSPEHIWVYDPSYIRSLLEASGFVIRKVVGTHSWSALAKRCGATRSRSLVLERWLEWVRLPSSWADLTTILAVRVTDEQL